MEAPWWVVLLALAPFALMVGRRRRDLRAVHAEPVPPADAERRRAVVAGLEQAGPTLRTGAAHVCRVTLRLADGTEAGVTRAIATDLLAHVAPGAPVEAWRTPADRVWRLDLEATRRAATGVLELAPIDVARTPDQVWLSPEEEAIADARDAEAIVHGVLYEGLVADTAAGRRCSITLGLAVVGGAPDVVVAQRVRLHELLAFPLGARVPVRVARDDPTRVVADAAGAVARLAARAPEPLAAPPGLAVGRVERLAWRGGSSGVRYGMRVRLALEDGQRTVDAALAPPDLLLVLPGSPVLVRRTADGVVLDLAATAAARAAA